MTIGGISVGNSKVFIILQYLTNIDVKVIIKGDDIRYSPRWIFDSIPDLKARLIEHEKSVISISKPCATIPCATIQTHFKSPQNSKVGGSTNNPCAKIQSCATITSLDIHRETGLGVYDFETQLLIQWFRIEGQHLLPGTPFRLTPWKRVNITGQYERVILHEIFAGFESLALRHGTFIANRRRRKEHFQQGNLLEE